MTKSKPSETNGKNPFLEVDYGEPGQDGEPHSQTNVDLPRCERCGATLLLFDEHKCGELEYPAYRLPDVTEKVEESKLNTLSSSFGHKDIMPEKNEANSVMISAEIVKLMLEDAKLEERQRVVEMIEGLDRWDEVGKDINGEYILISDLQSKLTDKETIPEGYILNPAEDGVAKYIKKKLEIKKWDNELCKIGKVVKEGECKVKKI